ncbi:D(1A) dopamine receptor isoform X3 [Meles meles]|uniref:D(1A) dopamine receptor isoform X3 n=1 Tax=Meles meles TaxID=9662 RepID=UPI001E69AC9F|nr:D(1A) dopamine receptor isoform X3 [Meles meles]
MRGTRSPALTQARQAPAAGAELEVSALRAQRSAPARRAAAPSLLRERSRTPGARARQDSGAPPGRCGAATPGKPAFRARGALRKTTSRQVSDLLVAVLVMPWKAVAEIAGFWPFGSFCNIWVAFDIMCSTASILNLCVISVDRYWAISSPFRYERKMTPKAAFILISVAWTLSVLISFIPVQLSWHKAKPTISSDGNATSLDDTLDNCDSSLSRTYAISSSLISFYIPVAIMIVTYTRIYRIAQKQIRRISALERAAVHAKNCQTTTAIMSLEAPFPRTAIWFI